VTGGFLSVLLPPESPPQEFRHPSRASVRAQSAEIESPGPVNYIFQTLLQVLIAPVFVRLRASASGSALLPLPVLSRKPRKLKMSYDPVRERTGAGYLGRDRARDGGFPRRLVIWIWFAMGPKRKYPLSRLVSPKSQLRPFPPYWLRLSFRRR
jgi:hypothetical protein